VTATHEFYKARISLETFDEYHGKCSLNSGTPTAALNKPERMLITKRDSAHFGPGAEISFFMSLGENIQNAHNEVNEACEPTRDYMYFAPSDPSANLLLSNPSRLSVRECAILCTSHPTCVGWTARTKPNTANGCKLFTSKAGKSEDVEYTNPSGKKTPMWISGERGCFDQPAMFLKNKDRDVKMGLGIALTGPGVVLKISFTGAASQEIVVPTSVQAYGDTMQLTVVCHSPTNFGIYVNGHWQANFTEIAQDFLPYTYVIIPPESKDNFEFLNVETRMILTDGIMGWLNPGRSRGLGDAMEYVGTSKAQHVSKFVEFYKSANWEEEVQYLMSGHNQFCHRNRGHSVVCNHFPIQWSAEGAGMGSGGKAISGWQGQGKDGRARISCKQGFSHFIDTCIEASLLATLPSPATWPDAKDVCKPLESKVFQVGSWLVWEAVKYFLAEKGNTEPFWVGRWEDVEANVFLSETISWADGGKDKSGSCIVADPVDLKWSRTSCNNPALFLCMLPKDASCPKGYTPIEGKHKSCYRISTEISGPEVAGGNVHASISTANKICMDDGASLASPESAVDRDALVFWAQQQGIPLTGIVSVSSPFKAFTGLRFYKKDADPYETEKYYSPWEASIQVADGTDRAGTGPSSPGWDKPCRYLKSVSSNTNTNLHTTPCLDEYAPTVERRAVCETRICEPASNRVCTFPFSTAGRRYDKCTLSGSGTAWCSTEVDSQGVHVPGKEQDCPATCSSSICPVGFWPHLNSCLQESATLPSDVVTSVEEAEERCFKQGARLYQPRSTRSLVVLAHRTAAFFKSGTSIKLRLI